MLQLLLRFELLLTASDFVAAVAVLVVAAASTYATAVAAVGLLCLISNYAFVRAPRFESYCRWLRFERVGTGFEPRPLTPARVSSLIIYVVTFLNLSSAGMPESFWSRINPRYTNQQIPTQVFSDNCSYLTIACLKS